MSDNETAKPRVVLEPVGRWQCSKHDVDLVAVAERFECPEDGCSTAADFGRDDCGVHLTGYVTVAHDPAFVRDDGMGSFDGSDPPNWSELVLNQINIEHMITEPGGPGSPGAVEH